MLATFVIGLREGLEAALIVSIVATFLKRRGQSMRPMWIGVVLAILLSVAVGVTLQLVAQALPQRQQEMLETVIGAVAVVFVTTMILWMRDHSRSMKKELEHDAAEALKSGGGTAMAVMAFLAVLKEGFESAVFLLATFQASSSVGPAALGSVLGFVVAALIGVGLYTGGVRMNLGRFFKITGPFLVFVAAGLVVSCLRTAHEATWIQIGQQRTVDLTWLAAPGTVRSALITGVLGIPSDPRVIEVIGYFAFLIPMLIVLLWPAKWMPKPTAAPRVSFAFAAVFVVAAAGMALGVQLPKPQAPAASVTLDDGSMLAFTQASATSAKLTSASGGNELNYEFGKDDVTTTSGKTPFDTWSKQVKPDLATATTRTLTLDQLMEMNGQRLPVGVNAQRNPGPFTAKIAQGSSATVTTFEGGIVSASVQPNTIITLSGGGLTGQKLVTLTGGATAIDDDTAQATKDAITGAARDAGELTLYKYWLPAVLVLAAAYAASVGFSQLRALRRDARIDAETGETGADEAAPARVLASGRVTGRAEDARAPIS